MRQHGRVLGSIVVSIPACHAGDRGSIPRRGGYILGGKNIENSPNTATTIQVEEIFQN